MDLMLFLRSVSITLVINVATHPVLCIGPVIRIKQARGQYSSRWCGHVNPETTLELDCPHHTWFHVLYKTASEDSISDCAGEYPLKSKALMSSSNSPPLATNCRGPQTTVGESPQRCDESIQVHSSLSKSNISFFEVTYECVNSGVQYKMCEQWSQTITSGDVYLASPSFFPPTSDDVYLRNITCHCTVTSDPGGFSARALYLSQHDDWNITCQSCKSYFNQPLENYPAVNEDLFQASQPNENHVFQVHFLPFSKSGQRKNELWIHVIGSSSIHLQCNMNNAAATPRTTSSASTKTDPPLSTSEAQQKSMSTGMYSSSDNYTTMVQPTSSKPDTIPGGVLVLFGFLGGAVCLSLLGVAVYWLRRYKKTKMGARGASGVQTPTAGMVETRRMSNDYDILQIPDQTQRTYDSGDVGTRIPRQELYRDSMSQPRAVSDGQFHLYTEVLGVSRDAFLEDHDGYMLPRLATVPGCTEER